MLKSRYNEVKGVLMKKSLLALTYAMLISAYPALMFVLIRESGRPFTSKLDGVDYGWVFYVLVVIGYSLVVGIIGMILAWIAYNKNRTDYILYGLILLGTHVLICIRYPIYMLVPLSILILGYFAYKDVKKLKAKAKADPNPVLD